MDIIREFIDFLERDIAFHESIGSSKRMDIHRWMINYLKQKLEKGH